MRVTSLHANVNSSNVVVHTRCRVALIDASPNYGSASDEALGGRIRAARSHRGLSVAELAGSAGVSKSLVSQIERGIAAPSIDTVRRLASALQMPVLSLFMEQ